MRAWTLLAATTALAVASEAVPPLAPAGDAERGRELVLSRDANCLLCHAVPGVDGRAMGNVGPPLAGVGRKLKAAALRLRIVDSSRINPRSIMPPYYRVDGLEAVAHEFRGKPVFTAQQVEDVVAYLGTLR